jgi:U3 small nucleolar RNA-associated protein 19
MQEYNLSVRQPSLVLIVIIHPCDRDYPSFYTRLYAFLDQDLLHLKYRSRFFRLTELFLSSTSVTSILGIDPQKLMILIRGFVLFFPPRHLPAALLASFVKRLSRLSLTAPPSSIVITIPFVYNILKRHPALMCMIHRDEVTSEPFEGTCRYSSRILLRKFIKLNA